MADYASLKVPDLKKLLQERGLVISGNKAELIARLQADDKKSGGATGGEDEIDWDEDDKTTTAAAAETVVAGDKGQVSNPTATPNQKVYIDPSTTTDLKATGGKDAPKAVDEAVASPGLTAIEPAPAPEALKQDFSIGLQVTDAQKEAEKRAARAKRFGIPENEEAKRLAERAKKFGLGQKDSVVQGLDAALPERRPKRVREEKQGGRATKRQTPDRRTEPKPKVASAPGEKKTFSKITDDPAEKAKAEARAKRFATSTA